MVWLDETVEKICRRMCEMQGLDPDQRIGLPAHAQPEGSDAYHYGPQWLVYEKAVRLHLLIEIARADVEAGR